MQTDQYCWHTQQNNWKTNGRDNRCSHDSLQVREFCQRMKGSIVVAPFFLSVWGNGSARYARMSSHDIIYIIEVQKTDKTGSIGILCLCSLVHTGCWNTRVSFQTKDTNSDMYDMFDKTLSSILTPYSVKNHTENLDLGSLESPWSEPETSFLPSSGDVGNDAEGPDAGAKTAGPELFTPDAIAVSVAKCLILGKSSSVCSLRDIRAGFCFWSIGIPSELEINCCDSCNSMANSEWGIGCSFLSAKLVSEAWWG